MRNLYSRNPEQVLEQQQMFDIKRRQGCRACCKRDLRVMVLGGLACSIPGNYPKPLYCNYWQIDEGVKNAENTKAA